MVAVFREVHRAAVPCFCAAQGCDPGSEAETEAWDFLPVLSLRYYCMLVEEMTEDEKNKTAGLWQCKDC